MWSFKTASHTALSEAEYGWMDCQLTPKHILTTSSLNLYAASIAHSNLRATLPHFFFRYIYIWFQLSMSPIPWDFKDLSVLEKEKKEDGLLVKILCCDLTASGPEADLLLDLGNWPNLHLMQLLLKFKDNNDILHIQLVISLRCRHSLSTSLTKWGAYLGWKLSTQIFRRKLQPFWNYSASNLGPGKWDHVFSGNRK